MSQVKVSGNASGTGVFEIAAPNTNTNYTLTLPESTGTLVSTNATQTLTNKTLGSGLVAGASLITSGTAVASTSGTSIDFTSIPSWVKRITVMFNGVSTNGTSVYQIQIGDGSVNTTGYVSSVAYAGTSGGMNSATSGFWIITANGASNTFRGIATFDLLSTNTWIASTVFGRDDGFQFIGTGSKALSGTLDRVRITTVNGTDTFDAGSINILYE